LRAKRKGDFPAENRESQKGRVYMKNTFKIFGIIAIVALIGLSFTACDEEDEGDDGVQKSLEITGIPQEIIGKFITIAICDLKDGKPNIKAFNQATARASTTVPLFSGNEKKKGEPYTGTGKSYIYMFVDKNATTPTKDNLEDDDIYAYTGTEGGELPFQYNITEEKTIIPFNVFAKLN
jgi:hypothetical protein